MSRKIVWKLNYSRLLSAALAFRVCTCVRPRGTSWRRDGYWGLIGGPQKDGLPSYAGDSPAAKALRVVLRYVRSGQPAPRLIQIQVGDPQLTRCLLNWFNMGSPPTTEYGSVGGGYPLYNAGGPKTMSACV